MKDPIPHHALQAWIHLQELHRLLKGHAVLKDMIYLVCDGLDFLIRSKRGYGCQDKKASN